MKNIFFSSHQHTLEADTYLGGWVGGGVEIIFFSSHQHTLIGNTYLFFISQRVGEG